MKNIFILILFLSNIAYADVSFEMNDKEARDYYYSNITVINYDPIVESKYLNTAANSVLYLFNLIELSYKYQKKNLTEKRNDMIRIAKNVATQNEVYYDCQKIMEMQVLEDKFDNCTEKSTKVLKVLKNMCSNNSRCGEFVGTYLHNNI